LFRKAIGALIRTSLNKVDNEMPMSKEDIRQAFNWWNDKSADEKRKWFDYNLQNLAKNI